MRKSKFFLTFGEAKKVLLEHDIKSSKDYPLKYKKIFGLPAEPKGFYKGSWVDWNDYLGKGYKNPPYEEAKKIVRALGIKKTADYRSTKTSKVKAEHKLPYKPYIAYKDKGWIGWDDYFSRPTKHMDYDEARSIVKNIDISGSYQWLVTKRDLWKKIPRMPANPQEVYKGRGWVSWEHFLGKSHKYASFEEARKIVQTLGIPSISQYRKIAIADRKKLKLPWYPDEIYKDEGWVSWKHFFGKDKKT